MPDSFLENWLRLFIYSEEMMVKLASLTYIYIYINKSLLCLFDDRREDSIKTIMTTALWRSSQPCLHHTTDSSGPNSAKYFSTCHQTHRQTCYYRPHFVTIAPQDLHFAATVNRKPASFSLWLFLFFENKITIASKTFVIFDWKFLKWGHQFSYRAVWHQDRSIDWLLSRCEM